METLKYKGYIGSVKYSDEDKCYFGRVTNIQRSGVTYEGDTLEELKADFEGAVDDYLNICKTYNFDPEKPIFSNISVRMPIDLHSHIARVAKANGESMNAYITRVMRRETENVMGAC